MHHELGSMCLLARTVFDTRVAPKLRGGSGAGYCRPGVLIPL